MVLSSPGAVGDFDGGALAGPAAASWRRAVTRPGAAQAGAHAVGAVVVVAGLPGRPGAEASVGGLVAELGEQMAGGLKTKREVMGRVWRRLRVRRTGHTLMFCFHWLMLELSSRVVHRCCRKSQPQ